MYENKHSFSKEWWNKFEIKVPQNDDIQDQCCINDEVFAIWFIMMKYLVVWQMSIERWINMFFPDFLVIIKYSALNVHSFGEMFFFSFYSANEDTYT